MAHMNRYTHHAFLKIIVLIVMMMSFKFDSTSQSLRGRIVYLSINENDAMNLWMVDLATPDQPEKLTDNRVPGTRIFDYQVSEDGRTIIYMAYNFQVYRTPEANEEIMLIDVQTREIRQISRCHELGSSCWQFSLSPDGNYVVYQLIRGGLSEIHLIDLNTPNYDERVIRFFGLQIRYIYHAFPVWVGNTNAILYRLPTTGGEIYDLTLEQVVRTLPVSNVRPVEFSPDGMRYVDYWFDPVMVIVRETSNPYNIIAKFERYDQLREGWLGAVLNDWHPDSEHLLIGSGYFRAGTDRLYSDIALLILNITTGEIQPLPHDGLSCDVHGSWNGDGTQIVFQRNTRQIYEENECDYGDIMIYDVVTQNIIELPIWGARPQWLNYSGD